MIYTSKRLNTISNAENLDFQLRQWSNICTLTWIRNTDWNL